MRRRKLQLGIEKQSLPTLGPLFTAILVCTYALITWFYSAFNIIISDSFSDIREFWSAPTIFSLSNFQVAAAINALFALLIVVLILQCVFTLDGREKWQHLIGYLSSLVVVGAWSTNLYGVATMPINDDWYESQVQNEVIGVRRVLLGRAINIDSSLSCDNEQTGVAVRLESGQDLGICIPIQSVDLGGVILVNETIGRFSGNVSFEYYHNVEADDPDFLWWKVTGSTEIVYPAELPETVGIVPASKGNQLVPRCSGGGLPKRPDYYWTPSISQIKAIERKLRKHLEQLNLSADLPIVVTLDGYGRQYIGLTYGGSDFFYGNFFPAERIDRHDMSVPRRTCDGGPKFWGILFNVKEMVFEDPIFDGVYPGTKTNIYPAKPPPFKPADSP